MSKGIQINVVYVLIIFLNQLPLNLFSFFECSIFNLFLPKVNIRGYFHLVRVFFCSNEVYYLLSLKDVVNKTN